MADRDLLIRHARTRGRELRAGALLVELGTATVLQTRVGVLQCAELVLGIALCDRITRLCAAQLEVGARDFGSDADLRAVQVGGQRLLIGATCFVLARSEERSVGTACVSTCRSRGSTNH